VEAIAAVRGGVDAGHCHRQGDGYCKVKNQTILGDSPDRQGGRPPRPVMALPLSPFLCEGVEILTHRSLHKLLHLGICREEPGLRKK
jgi:hypothetical protein